jgi:DNA mismatch repair protein MSH4
LNSRAQENVEDLLLMTHERIQECIQIARQNFDALASLSDAIALIDMCHSFADNVASSNQPWCRPTVTDCCPTNEMYVSQSDKQITNSIVGSGAIAIRNGRFAIRNGRFAIDVSKTGLLVSDTGEQNHEFIPNDTYASAFQNFTVITGINGSGKR